MFAYCNNNPISKTDSSGSISIDATQNGDIITASIKDDGQWGPIHYVVVIEAEYNIVDDFDLEWGDAVFSFGYDGIVIVMPNGTNMSYEYGDNY